MENEEEAKALVEKLKTLHPGRTDEWYVAWMRRMAHYVQHSGDMAGAPELPEE